MSGNVKTITPRTSAQETAENMRSNRIRHMLVARNAHLGGNISDRDLRRAGKTAADIMSTKPLTVESTAPLMAAIMLFLKRRISCLAVVDNGQLRGVLTSTDLMVGLQATLQLLCNYAERPATEATWRLLYRLRCRRTARQRRPAAQPSVASNNGCFSLWLTISDDRAKIGADVIEVVCLLDCLAKA